MQALLNGPFSRQQSQAVSLEVALAHPSLAYLADFQVAGQPALSGSMLLSAAAASVFTIRGIDAPSNAIFADISLDMPAALNSSQRLAGPLSPLSITIGLGRASGALTIGDGSRGRSRLLTCTVGVTAKALISVGFTSLAASRSPAQAPGSRWGLGSSPRSPYGNSGKSFLLWGAGPVMGDSNGKGPASGWWGEVPSGACMGLEGAGASSYIVHPCMLEAAVQLPLLAEVASASAGGQADDGRLLWLSRANLALELSGGGPPLSQGAFAAQHQVVSGS